jgi:hypothetical protein
LRTTSGKPSGHAGTPPKERTVPRLKTGAWNGTRRTPPALDRPRRGHRDQRPRERAPDLDLTTLQGTLQSGLSASLDAVLHRRRPHEVLQIRAACLEGPSARERFTVSRSVHPVLGITL